MKKSNEFNQKGIKGQRVLSPSNIRFFRYLLEYKDKWLREAGLYDFVNETYFSFYYPINYEHKIKLVRKKYETYINTAKRSKPKVTNEESAVWDLF